jgi:hypothetical protein
VDKPPLDVAAGMECFAGNLCRVLRRDNDLPGMLFACYYNWSAVDFTVGDHRHYVLTGKELISLFLPAGPFKKNPKNIISSSVNH